MRTLNICYFFITDQVEKGNAQIEHCRTDNMVGDFFTKPLQGKKFLRFRKDIFGHLKMRQQETRSADVTSHMTLII
jgi:hypothetical protein